MLITLRRLPVRLFATCAALVAGLVLAPEAEAQSKRVYRPLKQDVAPGIAGGWATSIDPTLRNACQEIRVELPGDGLVTFYEQGAEVGTLTAPAQAGIQVGPIYRFKISGMANYPGRELYPTVELVSRLHPPPGKETLYPVPISLTDQEIAAAISGRMVTKVIYLEQPDLARPFPHPPGDSAPTTRVARERDALQFADEMGRPVAIVRVGGRLAPTDNDPRFFGAGAPVRLQQPGEVRTVPTTSRSSRSDNRPGGKVSAVQPVGYEAPRRESAPKASEGDQSEATGGDRS